MRELLHTDDFDAFYYSLDERTTIKHDEALSYLETVYVLSNKFVKKIVNTNLYEMRVSVGTNEYRTIIFASDHENVIQATTIILLNGFLKKSSKDYDKQIKKAIKILNDLEL
ncbi:MAG: type II toxin-antitoxin system RelE/ParE family toxin [Prevotella sp.]|jgi:hypothetical protein|nr:type II toxin-antitoxin system RelE/ParE family toxin [Prevotella sp.]